MTQFNQNNLGQSHNPYLRQHADNPIHWQIWGKEALAEAKTQNKPIFISIGYATCHWCHVMSHESFSDMEVANFLNQHFVSIKVDREEYPEVDQYYMSAAQIMGIQGGWPLSVFADYEGKPFFIGTYFPLKASAKYQVNTFPYLLESIMNFWEKQPGKVLASSEKIYQALKDYFQTKNPKSKIVPDSLEFFGEDKEFLDLHQKYYDEANAGFKFQSQNKFPSLMNLAHLLKIAKREKSAMALNMVEESVEAMIRGGIYDQLGGGLSRYSTDYRWEVPHFEKMLYDNALMLDLLSELFDYTQKEKYKTWAYHIIEYFERDMKEEGVFYSAEDADSEGEEGTFYLWDYHELEQISQTLNLDWSVLENYFDCNPSGDLRGKIVLHLKQPAEEIADLLSLSLEEVNQKIEKIKQELYLIREKRTHPIKDKKVVVAWNGYMLAAYAKWGRVANDPKLITLAETGLNFFYEKASDGNLARSYLFLENNWESSTNSANLSDWTSLLLATLELYQTKLFQQEIEDKWLDWSYEILLKVNREFKVNSSDFPSDLEVYSEIHHGHDFLLDQMVDAYDGVEPSGNSMMAWALLKMDVFFPNEQLIFKAEKIFNYFYQHITGTSLPFMLGAFHQFKRGLTYLKLTGPEGQIKKWLKEIGLKELLLLDQIIVEPVKSKEVIAILCFDKRCSTGVTRLEELKEQLISLCSD